MNYMMNGYCYNMIHVILDKADLRRQDGRHRIKIITQRNYKKKEEQHISVKYIIYAAAMT